MGDNVMCSFVFSRMQVHNGMGMFEERIIEKISFALFKKQTKTHHGISSASSSLP